GILNKYHIPISAEIKVGSLSMAQRQLVEIAKGLSYPSDVVIFDEPTSSLSDSEVEILFNIISELKSENKAIIYVSHKMAEIMRISDDITVMRDGQYIDTVDKAETSIDPLITMMVGREMNDIYPSKNESTSEIGDLVLSVKSLTNPNAFHNVSFDLHAGEVVGFFGLVGAGRSDVMNALFGMLPYEGEIIIKGKKVAIETPIIAIENGIAFVTENRKEEGLVLDHSVHINCNLASFERIATRGLLNEQAEVSQTEDSIKRMNIRVQNRHQSVGSLSGGNQQKIVLAKWLERQPDILILDEPTRGVDVGAKYEIYSIIRELTEKGTAVILVSSELPEVMNMSDRLFVMREKKLVKEFKTKGLTQDKVMVYATGVDSND
ncbi:MAG: sugar ABC transporter ATP-binding protein, partial [Gammaproteobacteria bacterium]|nr:sugar ABC transporter ATP-binding protein [Gammaproteobacteria bacterium]MBU1465893.1 sugar ABC transporter ATP-binding protein [Gammaproteobacteria bacterium]